MGFAATLKRRDVWQGAISFLEENQTVDPDIQTWAN